MSPLNLDAVSPYFAAEPATPALGSAGVSPTGRDSFGEHLQRARQTVDTSTNTHHPPADTTRPADPQTPPATEDHPPDPKTPPATEDHPADPKTPPATEDRPADPKTSPATENRPAADGDSPAVESDKDATPRPDPGHEERDQSEANKEIGDSETEATSDGEDRSETGNSPAEAGAAAVESDATAGNVNDDAATKSIDNGEISGDPPAPEESAPVRQHEGQQNSRQSPAAPPGQQPGRSAAAGNLVPDETQESGRVRAETMPEENANAASTTEVEQATVAESPDERNDGVPAASGAANSQQDGTTPKANSRGRGRRQVGGHAAADRSDDIHSGKVAKDAESATTPPDQRQDTQAAATRPTVAADGIKAEVGDQTAEMSPTSTGEAEASGPLRAAAGQGTRPGPATQNPGNSAPDQVDRVRFVQRVARAFEAIGDRGGSIQLRLHPPELGSLRLQATIRNGVMTIRLEAETETARSILLDNLPALRDRLAAQDIKVQQFDVDLTDRSFGGSAEQPGGDPQPHDHPKDNAPNTGPDQPLETQRPSQPGMAIEPGRENQLDVII